MADFDPHQYAKPIDFDPYQGGASPIEEQASELQKPVSDPSIGMFDPANETGLGTYVPQGTYQNPINRLGAAAVLPMLAPELAAGTGIAARYFINPAINAMSRIGAGTASNLAYESPDIKNKQDLMDKAKSAASMNALLEGILGVPRAIGGMAEMFNPLKYATQKAENIIDEYKGARAAQREAYRPVTEQYGDSLVSVTPKNYLGFGKQDIKYFTPEVKKSYGDFLDEPTFQNLHNLQSQMGKDWSRIATNPSKINTAQTLDASRNMLKDKIQSFLSRDENALNQYNLGNEITKNQVMPYLANKTLRNVVEGGKTDLSPAQLSHAIKQGTEKVVTKGANGPIMAIPEGHALRNHLKDLDKITDFGKIAKAIIPAGIGAAVGESVHPGVGGAVGGGLIGSGIGSMASKVGAGNMLDVAQNPLVQHLFSRYLNPLASVGGRGFINYTGGNQ